MCPWESERAREKTQFSNIHKRCNSLSLWHTHQRTQHSLHTLTTSLSLSLSLSHFLHTHLQTYSLYLTQTLESVRSRYYRFHMCCCCCLFFWSLTTFYIPYVCFIAEEVKHIFRFFQTKRRSRALNNSRESRLWFKISHFFRMIFRMSFQRGYCVPPCRGRRPISVQKK